MVSATIIPAAGCDGRVELGERDEAWRAGLPDELAEAYLAEAEVLQPHHYVGRVREVLERPDVRHGIVRMAFTLLRHRTLSGAQVEGIVDECDVICERPQVPLGWPDPDDEFDDEAYSWSRL